MAITIRERLAPSWYTPKSEQDEANPTRFRVQPLDGLQHMEVLGEVELRDGRAIISARGFRLCAQGGIVGWEGVSDGDGKPVEFAPSKLRLVDADVLLEVGLHIYNLTEFGEDAEKNS